MWQPLPPYRRRSAHQECPLGGAVPAWTQPAGSPEGQAGAMDEDLAAAVTEELRRFVDRTGNRRTLPPTCRVGVPAGEQVLLPVVPEPSLRADLVERAIDGLTGTSGACAWLTRGG